MSSSILGWQSAAEIEVRLEEAVRQLRAGSACNSDSEEETDENREDDHDDEDEDEQDMYNDHPSSSSTSDLHSFIPQFPLEALENGFTPQHRLVRVDVKSALSLQPTYDSPGQKNGKAHLRVIFAPQVSVVDVFAAVDYPGR